MGGGGGKANWGGEFQARGPRMRAGMNANWGADFQRSPAQARNPVMRRASHHRPVARGPMVGGPMMMGGMGMNPMMMQPMMMQPMMGGPMVQQPVVQQQGPTIEEISDSGKVVAQEKQASIEEKPVVQENASRLKRFARHFGGKITG